MPTIKLTPSTYYLSSSSYLSVANAANMYDDTSSTNYATVTNSRTSTSSYYTYLRGFDFSQVPEAAIVSDIKIRVKANHSGGYAQAIYLYDGTSASLGSSSTSLSGTVQTHEINYSGTWEALKEAGSDLGIRINCRRASRNTTSYVYIYGAEIEVTYTLPTPRTITSSLSGNGTISPSGAFTTYDGEEYVLTITPADASETVAATKDGVDITDQLKGHGAGDTTEQAPADVTTSGVQSGSSYMQYAVGHTAESPSSSGMSSNAYASSGSTGYAEYSFDFSGIPAGATIESIEAICYGHRENSAIDSTHISRCAIYDGDTAISEDVDFPSTSNSRITLEASTLPSSISGVTIRHFVGYYGGLVLGITMKVTYSTGGAIQYYTYSCTVSGDAVIVVTIGGGGGETSKLYIKDGGSWKEVAAAYRKVNGAWVQVTDLTKVFSSSSKYRRGD